MRIEDRGGRLEISYTAREIETERTHFPAEDFAGAQFDSVSDRTSEIVLLLSTPRSGSSFLCDQLRLRAGFVTHEYFGARHAIPHLADRWGCLTPGGKLDLECYVEQLKRNRTGAGGVLGLNVHGFHLPVFDHFMPLFGDIPMRVIWMERQDRIAQAISLTIAHQTQKWTKYHAKKGSAHYDFATITQNLTRLAHQDAMLEAFVHKHALDVHKVSYEAVIGAPGEVVPPLLAGIPLEDVHGPELITKQGTSRNLEWKQRYMDDCLQLVGKQGHGGGLSRPWLLSQEFATRGKRKATQYATKIQRLARASKK